MARLSRPGWLVKHQDGYPRTVTHPNTNRARRRATTLIETNTLPLSQTATESRRQQANPAWHGMIAVKPSFHYTSWRPELMARVDGWPVSIHPSIRAINSGSGNRALHRGVSVCASVSLLLTVPLQRWSMVKFSSQLLQLKHWTVVLLL